MYTHFDNNYCLIINEAEQQDYLPSSHQKNNQANF